MTTLLQINSSLFSANGQSTQLADAFVSVWQKREPDRKTIVRDLAVNPIPHLDADRFTAFLIPQENRTEIQQRYVNESEALIAEIKSAEIIVIGLPMYNLGIPSTLKAYFDHIARAGITFRYTENGPEGLLTGKKVYIFATRGGQYANTDWDTQTTYMRHFLAFLGITDVEFVYAEGLNKGDVIKAAALAEAQLKMSQISI